MTISTARITSALQHRLAAELFPGERVLYAAQPAWRAEVGKLVVIFVASLGWTAFACTFFCTGLCTLFGIGSTTADTHSAGAVAGCAPVLLALPLVVAGCAGLAAPFLRIRKSNNTLHALTEHRVINVYAGADQGVESYNLASVNFVVRRDRGDGTGNLEIGYGVAKDVEGNPRPLTTHWYGVPEARRAEALIQEHASWVRRGAGAAADG